VEGFIDRLAELFKTLFPGESGGSGRGANSAGQGSGSRGFIDPDVQAAWEELDEYMRTGTNRARTDRGGSGAGGRSSGGYRRARTGTPKPPDESLRRDYANLEVPFGASIDVVLSSYKRLMLKYHPDKFAGDPEKQKIALEIAKKINQSFQRIKDHQESEEWSS
jgi:hypothetical protein